MNKYYILVGILFILLTLYIVDRTVFMKKRVLSHNLWEYTGGDIIRGDFIDTRNVIFKRNTMIFDYFNQEKDTLILKYQYFSMMKVIDPKTKKSGKYTMKGANWTNYIPFFGRKWKTTNSRH